MADDPMHCLAAASFESGVMQILRFLPQASPLCSPELLKEIVYLGAMQVSPMGAP